MTLRRKLTTIGAALAAAILALTVGATAAGASQQLDTAPYYGGDRVSVPICCANQYDAASTGFNMWDGPNHFVTTAGHFGPVGTVTLAGIGGPMMGRVAYHSSAQDTDVVPVSSSAGYVWASNTTTRTVYSWETTNQDIGTHVCTAGATTGHEICGALNVAYNQPWLGGNYAVRSSCPGTVQCSLGGDSGGPVYAVCTIAACNGQVEAVGEIVGGGDYTATTHFVVWIPIRYIMAWVHTFDAAANILCILCSHG